jgi:hypothetical protein
MRWMGPALLVFGCAALAPRSAYDQKLDSGKFAFGYGEGAAWYGYDVLHVADDGSCRYTFSELPEGSDVPVWKRHEWKLDESTLNALKSELNDAGFVRLKAGQPEPDESKLDEAAFVWVRFGTKPRVVRVTDDRPVELTRIVRYVTQSILDPRRSELENATPIDAEVGKAAAKAGLSPSF